MKLNLTCPGKAFIVTVLYPFYNTESYSVDHDRRVTSSAHVEYCDFQSKKSFPDGSLEMFRKRPSKLKNDIRTFFVFLLIGNSMHFEVCTIKGC